jgi:hypothetical protein
MFLRLFDRLVEFLDLTPYILQIKESSETLKLLSCEVLGKSICRYILSREVYNIK